MIKEVISDRYTHLREPDQVAHVVGRCIVSGLIRPYARGKHGIWRTSVQADIKAVTICTLTYRDEAGDVRIERAMAFCGPRDQFSRARGRKIALGRAWLAAEKVKEGPPSIEATLGETIIRPGFSIEEEPEPEP